MSNENELAEKIESQETRQVEDHLSRTSLSTRYNLKIVALVNLRQRFHSDLLARLENG
jgi:hypothetical protein